MEIVVKIPDDMIKSLEQGNFGTKYNIYDLVGCLMNGTPLPEGHGRLIDADAYRKELRIEIPNSDYDGSLEPYAEGIYSAIMSLDDVPTIIEADKGETDGK